MAFVIMIAAFCFAICASFTKAYYKIKGIWAEDQYLIQKGESFEILYFFGMLAILVSGIVWVMEIV